MSVAGQSWSASARALLLKPRVPAKGVLLNTVMMLDGV